jgi:hypothetical protein
VAHSEVTVAPSKVGMALSGAIWQTLWTTDLNQEDRTGETKLKDSLYIPITAPDGSRILRIPHI